MKYSVEPLRTQKEISEFLSALDHGKNRERNRVLVLLGINTGLRISDILALDVGQIRENETIQIVEIKTGKKRWLFLHKLQPVLKPYLVGKSDETPLFLGRNGRLTVNGAYRLFQRAAKKIGRKDIGTHTLRKTFGYHYYQQTHDIATLMLIFNHTSEVITRRYLGLDRDVIEQSLSHFALEIF